MNTAQHYRTILDEQPTLDKCFFAFSQQQFEEGRIKAGIGEDEKINQSEYGLFGTKEGLDETFKFYEEQRKRIAAECNLQEVYHYEWNDFSEQSEFPAKK